MSPPQRTLPEVRLTATERWGASCTRRTATDIRPVCREVDSRIHVLPLIAYLQKCQEQHDSQLQYLQNSLEAVKKYSEQQRHEAQTTMATIASQMDKDEENA